MCTVFSDWGENPSVVAKNFDCFVDGGMIFTNKRGVRKASLVMPPKKEFLWTSQYGSVTFSQSGKGMPACGINEKGLIVEQATYPKTVYPAEDERAEISCLEAVQYLLDTCERVEEAMAAFDRFRISNQSGRLHFFLMDRRGNRAVVEFRGGEKNVFSGADKMPVLVNSGYEQACAGKAEDASEYEENSMERFRIVRTELEREKRDPEEPEHRKPEFREPLTVEAAFRILELAKRKDTVFGIVYDREHECVYFRYQNLGIKQIDLRSIDYLETADSYLFDMESDVSEFAWQPYSREMNRKNVERFYQNPVVLQMFHMPDAGFVIDAFDEHIQKTECGWQEAEAERQAGQMAAKQEEDPK